MIAALPLVTSALAAVGGSTSESAATAAKSLVSGAGDSFTSMLASLSQGTVDKLKASEQMSVAGIEGKASTQSVVESVMSAQESLQTMIAVRDKAVASFQEISRMAI